MSQEKLKNIHYFVSYSKFKETWNFCFFGNIFVNNGLKHFVFGLVNLHRLLATYQKYFDSFFVDPIEVKI